MLICRLYNLLDDLIASKVVQNLLEFPRSTYQTWWRLPKPGVVMLINNILNISKPYEALTIYQLLVIEGIIDGNIFQENFHTSTHTMRKGLGVGEIISDLMKHFGIILYR